MATPLTRAEWLDECAKLAKTYEEAMTDEAKALVERMGLTLGEWLVDEAPNDWWEYQRDHMKARDLLETQAREIERLRVALGKIARETTKVIPELINQQMCIDAVNAHARAALAGDSHDQ